MIARRGFDADLNSLDKSGTGQSSEEAILQGADSWITHENADKSLKERNQGAFNRLVREMFLSGKDVWSMLAKYIDLIAERL
jgi:hypothetical protein